jgi:adenylylsulfate kinase-like enzyme
MHEEAGVDFYEVHVATPVEVTSRRDVKGLYAKAYAGEIANYTGVHDTYEPPSSPDLVIRTQDEPVAESAARVLALLETRA